MHGIAGAPDETQRHSLQGQLMGDDGRHRLGSGKAFYGLKPYVPGDDPRRLDWSVYARSRHPHIRQYYQDETPTIWWVVLDSPAWQTGYTQPLQQMALQAVAIMHAFSNPGKVGWLWLGQTGWRSQPPGSPERALHQLGQQWQPFNPDTWLPYHETTGLLVLPEALYRRDVWIVLAPWQDSRIADCRLWPCHHLQVWPLADAWWQRYSLVAMAGLPLQAGCNTLLSPAHLASADTISNEDVPLWANQPLVSQISQRLSG
jgi:hypothetical protein